MNVPTDGTPLLSVRDLAKSYSLRADGYRVLDSVSFDVYRGETLGIVGESGCGKSTLARAIMRLGPVNEGQVLLEGTDLIPLKGAALRAMRTRFQMVFQDPFGSLDPRMTVLQIVEQPLHVQKVAGDRRKLAQEMLGSLGLGEDFWDRQPKDISGGQRQRVAIARALVLHPEILVLDEPVSALDVSVQAQVLDLLRQEQRNLGLTYLFIVHDLAAAEYFCDRILVLYLGQIVESAEVGELYDNPLHPYTVSLFSAAPDPSKPVGGRVALRGEPQARRPWRGCPFESRCPVADDRVRCRTEAPTLKETADGHLVACHFPGELKP